MVENSPVISEQQNLANAKSLHLLLTLYKESQNSQKHKIDLADLKWTETLTYPLFEINLEDSVSKLALDAPTILAAAQEQEESRVDAGYADWQVKVMPEEHLGASTDGAYMASCKDRIEAR